MSEQVAMTVEQAIEFARVWQKGLTVYPGAMGWRVVCMVLADEVERLQARVAELESQLPEEMKHCTIQFRECEKGHGWLTASNWVQHECATCERDELRRRVAELEAQAQAVEDSEICATAELMMIHDRFMRGVLTKEIMIDAVNRVGKESIAKIKADAVREAIAAVDTLDISGMLPRHKVGFCACIDELEKYANQIEGVE